MSSSTESPKITLYTSYACPWAHRSQIALRELALPFDTVIVDLSVPRTPEYLAINPRGLVPALSYNGIILTESAIVSQFLVDTHPSHLEKASTDEGGPLQRARINFFVDTFIGKLLGLYMATLKAEVGQEKEGAGRAIVDAVVKELEPLLGDAGPFFGGSDRLTLAEVQTASFVTRMLSFAEYEALLPKSLLTSLEAKAPNFWKWATAVVKEDSVNYKWDAKAVSERTIERTEKLRKEAAAAK
ncbi:Glutathione S-transferase [Lachnellula occidentalis]|uniref:Glutathione S-transferase n=1 Tax=Lachnellula occidentalis TaxID=215460 RepID=A0A8H8UES7_9HELO|nr:Glutathione S-transferase [Lachnellula occidentalis]